MPREAEDTVTRAKMVSRKNSGGPNSSTSCFATGSTASTDSVPMMPPSEFALAAAPIASPALPCCASGWPSRQVAALGAVPGAFRRIAVIDPPIGMAPMTPPESASAVKGSSP